MTTYVNSIGLESHFALIQKVSVKVFARFGVGEVFEMGFLWTFILINKAEVWKCVCTSVIVALLMITVDINMTVVIFSTMTILIIMI